MLRHESFYIGLGGWLSFQIVVMAGVGGDACLVSFKIECGPSVKWLIIIKGLGEGLKGQSD